MMEIKELNDHRFYLSEYGIATIHLGGGDVMISDLLFKDEPFAGIGFSLIDKAGDIGQSYPEHCGKDATDIGVFFQIISSNPDSLQVVIDKLIDAKNSLIESN